MKKILSLLLVLTLVCSLGIFVYGEDTGAAEDAAEEVVEEVAEEVEETAAEAAPAEAPARSGLSGANKGLIAAVVLLAFGGVIIMAANKKIKGPKKSDK